MRFNLHPFVLRKADNWQKAQHRLADHAIIGPWLRDTFVEDVLVEVQSIIREAEERLKI
jgi:hypothetical protein